MAQLQDEEVGDGTTSVVIVAAELLKNADELVKQKIHPTSIMAGYRLACKEAVKYIQVRKSSFCEFSLPSPFDKFFHFRELLPVQFGHFRKSMVLKKMLFCAYSFLSQFDKFFISARYFRLRHFRRLWRDIDWPVKSQSNISRYEKVY